ncbi:MAG: cell envelope biogenesis protein OmpA [Rhodoferax sp.]|nr:cell envelope biogenesis protein OmpA [Rhodoferax sp.]
MIGIKATRRKAGKDEAEKPFWISFSDLMTALMVLFLVAMAVALIAVTQGLATIEKGGKDRDKAIKSCIADVDALTKEAEFKGVSVRDQSSIDFGTLVEFAEGKHTFENPVQEQFVRKFVPRVLELARHVKCKKWLKRVVVEGFASQTGPGYLYNLNLSYLRSQRVMCVLLNSQVPDVLPVEDRELIQTLFLVGGRSFNTSASQATSGPLTSMVRKANDKRVELKLEFRDLGSDVEKPAGIPLDPGLRCPN